MRPPFRSKQEIIINAPLETVWGGKHTCVEKDIEIVPMQKVVTVLPEDTFGISKVLPDYVVETTAHRVGQFSTKEFA